MVDPWLANDGPRDRRERPAAAERLFGALADCRFPADDGRRRRSTRISTASVGTPGPHPTATHGSRPFPAPATSGLTSNSSVTWRDERLAPLVDAGLIDAIAPGDRITDEVGVEDAPGHDEGHLTVRIDSAGETAVIPGHLFLSPLQLADPSIAFDIDPATAAATRTKLLTDLAERQGLLLSPLLGGPGGGVVRRAGAGWSLEVGAGSAA